jgi:hypothetical protein
MKIDNNIDAFVAASRLPGCSPTMKAYARERLAAAKSRSGMMDWDRFAYAIGGAGNCVTQDSSCAAGHGRSVTRAPGYNDPCPVVPPRCDCQVIGGNTLGGNQITAASQAARFGNVTLDSGDASYFVPSYIFITSFLSLSDTTVDPTGATPVLLADSRSGREPNLRRASTTDPSFGILATIYGDQKELECVDWLRFASVNNQQLVITLYNCNDAAIHGFVDLWGIPAA